MASKDLTGMRFGKLAVVEKTKINNHGEAHWLCLCDCGNTHIATSYNLTHGKTTQCRKCMCKQISSSNTKHGCKPKRLHEAYVNMRTRCENPNYYLFHRYGGRGITVCKEWTESYIAFRDWALENGYSDNLTLDRIDNNGNYCPENCKWSTVTEQANNRRTNRILTLGKEKDSMANWSRKTGIPYWVLERRVNSLKWSDEKALSTPYRRKK